MFEKIVDELNLGKLISNPSRVYGGLTHKMYSVETENGHYVVKILNPNIMKRSNALFNFKRADSLEKRLKENNIPCIYSINGINKIDDNYIYVFDFYGGKVLENKDITKYNVKKIGEVMAKIHNIDIKNGLCFLHEKDFDFNHYIDLAKEKKSVIYDYLYDKLDILNGKLNKSNEAISRVNNISCICHNDMDPKNVMWKNDDFKIIDLECLCYSDPYKDLLEVALRWSGYEECNINYELLKEFIKSYKDNTKLNMNIDWEQIYYVNDGSLGWLEYNIKRALELENVDEEEKKLGINEVKETIKHVMYYDEEKDNIINAIKEVLKG